MPLGRLIRIRDYRGNYNPLIYVVAEPEAQNAIEILNETLLFPYEAYEDLGQVNDSLIVALKLKPREYSRL